MKGTIKIALVSAGSFILGYAFGAESLKQKYLLSLDEELDAQGIQHRAKLDKMKKHYEELLDDRIGISGHWHAEDEVLVAQAVEAMEHYRGVESAEEEIILGPNLPPEAPVHYDYTHSEKEAAAVPNTVESIHVIDDVTLVADDLGYQHIALIYYKSDGVMTTATDQVLSEEDARICFGDLLDSEIRTTTKDSINIRNPGMATDFEVSVMDTKYVDEVLGQGDHA